MKRARAAGVAIFCRRGPRRRRPRQAVLPGVDISSTRSRSRSWKPPARHPCDFVQRNRVRCELESVALWIRQPDGTALRAPIPGPLQSVPGGQVVASFRCALHPLGEVPANER